MLNEPTVDKLKTMGLHTIAEAWQKQQGTAEATSLSFDERLGLLVDAEWTFRENRRIGRALREAKLKLGQACLEDLDYSPKRELDKSVVRQLATCRWIAEHQNVLVTGAAGTGKSYLACALAHQACRKGYRAIYRRATRLFSELALARHDGTYARLLAKLARVDVLIVDDWALAPIKDDERRDLLEVLEDRYGTRSTIVTSQLDPKRWHDHIADPTHADAICDRLVHNAHRIALMGPSKRKEPTSTK
jgi:DNA replication protein DnaC